MPVLPLFSMAGRVKGNTLPPHLLLAVADVIILLLNPLCPPPLAMADAFIAETSLLLTMGHALIVEMMLSLQLRLAMADGVIAMLPLLPLLRPLTMADVILA
jgi:hypothetical protein